MESGTDDNYITLVLQLQTAADGAWQVSVTGTYTADPIPLVPGILVVRLWRPPDTNLLRGTIRLHNSDHWAPLQSNGQLEELIRAWLFQGGSSTNGN